MTAQGLSRWVEQGIVLRRGRGPRRAVLVSLEDVRREAEWRRNSVSQAEAVRILRTEPRAVERLCASGELPFRQPAGPGGDVFINRASVERLAAMRAADAAATAEKYVTTRAAVELTGWPRWVIDRLGEEGKLSRVPGRQGALLVDRGQLTRLIDEFARHPDICPVCGETLPPGRRFHKGHCAGTIAGAEFVKRQPSIVAAKREQLDRFTAAKGLRTVEEVARECRRSGRVIWRHVWNNELGDLYPGPGGRVVLLDHDDVTVIRGRLCGHHDNPLWRGGWYRARHKSTAEFGRHNKALAARKGKRVGAPVQVSDWQEDLAVERRGQRWTYARIAAETGLSIKQVRLILAAHGLVSDFPGRPGRLSPEQRGNIRRLRAKGLSQSAIAQNLGVSRDQVRGELAKASA